MAYPMEFRVAVAASYDEHGSSIEVADLFGCSESWVRRLIQRREATGSLEPLTPKRPDTRKLDDGDLARLRTLIARAAGHDAGRVGRDAGPQGLGAHGSRPPTTRRDLLNSSTWRGPGR